MRKMPIVGALACGLVLAYLAIPVQADCGCGGASNQSYRALSGPSCFSPPGCYLAPGCCECPPSACDNAWEGYCQHKAKWQAYFAKVGTPRPSYYYGKHYYDRNGYYGNYPSPTPAMREIVPAESTPSPEPVLTPAPTIRPVPPVPVPEKVSRTKVLYPWMR